jgi:hypothetical protein
VICVLPVALGFVISGAVLAGAAIGCAARGRLVGGRRSYSLGVSSSFSVVMSGTSQGPAGPKRESPARPRLPRRPTW